MARTAKKTLAGQAASAARKIIRPRKAASPAKAAAEPKAAAAPEKYWWIWEAPRRKTLSSVRVVGMVASIASPSSHEQRVTSPSSLTRRIGG